MPPSKPLVAAAVSLVLACLAVNAGAQVPSAPPPRVDPQIPSIPARITQAIDEKNLVMLKGNVHPLAQLQFDQGPVSDALPLNRMLLLLQRGADQEAALEKLLDDQQDKSSPSYHAWLTPQQFGQQFGPADADIQTITTWLQSHGFQVNNVTAGRTLMEFSGTAGQVRAAFHTEIHNYLVNGELHTANASDPQIPAALAPVVVGPVSLNSFSITSHMRQLGTFHRAKGSTLAQPVDKPLYTFPGCTPAGCFALGPADFATIYNSATLFSGTPKVDGTGQTIAIVGESDIDPTDVTDFQTMFGMTPNFSAANNIILNGADPGKNGSEGESDLDVQWASAVAPGATIKFVTSQPTETTAGIFLSAVYIVENNLAGVMSESFGGCEQQIGTLNQFHNSLWQQAAAQGITAILSAGDGGSAGCDNFDTQQTATQGLAVSGFASTPYNIAVGGTDFDEINRWSQFWSSTNTSPSQSSALSYIPEIPWNDSCAQLGITGCGTTAPNGSLNIVAGSGGVSTLYGKPSWQSGTGVPSDGHRDLPDVSLFASNGFDGTFYVMCQKDRTGTSSCNLGSLGYTFQGVGGTSVSAPSFAGIMALVNHSQATAQNPAPRQGNANYVLYPLFKKQTSASPAINCNSSATPSTSCTFYDVTKGNSFLPTGVGTNSVPCTAASLNCSNQLAAETNGVLVVPGNSSTEAYTVSTGYDLVTGLGSVNIANLVKNWSSVSSLASTTTLTATVNGQAVTSITGITHGTPVSVTSSVAAGQGITGTPSGQVALLATPNPTANAGPSLGFDVLTLDSTGNATDTGAVLPGGQYNLTAHYQGDGTFGSSDSTPPISVSISAEPSKTIISIPVFDPTTGRETGNAPASLVYGSPYIARIDVGNAQAALSFPPLPLCTPPACPTGTITWTDSLNGAPAVPLDGGTFALNTSGYTEDQPIQLSGGSYVLSASYSGDGSFAKSSSTYTLTITPAPTTNALVVDTGLPVAGQPFNVSVNGVAQTQTGAAPTGTVTFFDGTTQLGSAVPITGTAGLNGAAPSFAANATLTSNNPGNRTLTAKYSGDANYAASSSVPVAVTLLIPTSIAFNVSATNITYGTSTVLTATLATSTKGPAISGGVLFFGSLQGDSFGTVTQTNGTDANGNATIQATVTTVLQGSQTIFAGYSGDSNYAHSTSQTISVQVNIPDFTLGPAGISVVPTAGQPGSGQFTVTPASQTPSTVNLTLSPLVISGYTITLGSQQISLNGSPVNVTLSMTPISTNSSNTQSNLRPRHTFVLVRPTGGPWPFALLAAFASMAILLFRPQASRTQTRLLVAANLTAVLAFAISCGGGGGVTSPPPPPPPQPQPTSITLSTSSAKVAQNQPFTITATVTSASTQPLTGTITFYNFGTAISGVPISNGQGQTGQGYINNPGLYSITASYSGDANNQASKTATPLTQVITGTMPATIQGNTGVDVHSIQVILGVQ